MTKFLILHLVMVFSMTFTYGQKLGVYYYPVSMDSTRGGRLKFLSDSTVELSNIRTHGGNFYRSVYQYISSDTAIEILPQSISDQQSQPYAIQVGQFPLEAKLLLTKIERGFIDYNRSHIYVRRKGYKAYPDLRYIIDGRTYILDMGVSDGSGILKKNPKRNRALEKKLKNIDIDNCTIEIVRGLDAYKRFGIDSVYGVIVITTKK